MEQISQKRQLAAIMFTDLVGYTALMGKDSNKTLELVRISKEIQKPLVEKHNGKWLKEMGDGAMAQFSTALDAVNCSIEIQEIARGKLDAKLRIGIHLGDVTVEEHDVHGDGVNVASRLESIADPGGIYVSDAIEKAIRGQSDIQAKYLGESKLKNVDYGVRTYALQGVGLPVPDLKQDKELTGRFLAELQRRGVLRAGILYILVSLVLILLLPYAHLWMPLPSWSGALLIAILVIGLPVALYFAWHYERSPEGFVKTTSAKSWQNPYPSTAKKPMTGNLVIGALLVITLFTFVYQQSWFSKATEIDKSVKRFNIIFPEEAPLALIGESEGQFNYSSLALSPDGSMLVYTGWRNGRSQLQIRYLDKLDIVPIEGTEGAYGPIFSPDGKWVAFTTHTSLRKVMVPDGTPIDIVPVNIQYGAVWTNNDEIIYSNQIAILKVSSRGGTPKLLYRRKVNDVVSGYNSSIDITPDQKHILFSDLEGDIFGLDIETGHYAVIYPKGGGAPKALPSGHLIFTRNNALFGVPFDFKTMAPLGQENQIISGIRTERSGPQLTYSKNGLAIHVPGYYYQRSAFVWLNKDGKKERVELDPDNYGSFDLSPNNRYLAISMLPAKDHIKVLDFNTGQVIRVRVENYDQLYSPVWSADSKSIIFGAQKLGTWKLYRKNITEVSRAQELDITNAGEWPYSLSENGTFLNVMSKIIKIDPESATTMVLEEIDGGNHMAISPNNAYTVYGSAESGKSEIYVQPFPATGEEWQISTDGGTDPIWAKDGIYYHNDIRIYFVPVKSFEPFKFGSPEVFYTGPFMNAVSRSLGIDKQDRLLILEPVGGSQLAREAIVTLNWFEEVKRLAPPED